MNKLVLFCHQYPYKTGDASFVKNEIDDLAASFDTVYLVTLEDHRAKGVYDLPPNVEHTFTGFESRREIVLRGLLNSGSAVTLVKHFLSDLVNVRRPRHLKHLLLACLFGRALAADKQVRSTLSPGDVSLYFFWGTGAAYLLAFLKDRSHVAVRFHGGDLYLERNDGYLPFRGPVFHRATELLAISENGGEYLKAQLKEIGQDQTKVSVKKLGTPDFGVRPATPNDGIVVASCSSVIPLKRVPFIFEVLTHYSRIRPIQWVHFGGGPFLEELKQHVIDNPAESLQVEFKGHTDNLALMQFYKDNRVDAFINLSTYEGIPVSIMEACSFDIPILATDVGGTSELVGEDHNTGILVEVTDTVEEVAEQLDALLESHEKWEPRRFWEQNHAKTTNNAALIEVLR